MRIPLMLAVYCTVVPAAAGLMMLCERESAGLTILNVSFDPTRELWRAINGRFTEHYFQQTGRRVHVRQSHGGSASQARSVIDGLAADVVTLALWNDTNVLREYGLLAPDWEQRFPNRSLPYTSTIVFVVRHGNPKGIRDWPDLVEPGVEVITPNPKTSGNGKLSFLAAWGSVRRRGGSDADARAFVTALYRHVPILDTGARGAATTFAQNGRGDVHLTWESEAHLEVREAGGGLDVVYPPASIRAEPPIAVVDRVVDARQSREVAEAYLRFLYERPTQRLIAEYDYRPIDAAVLRQFRTRFPQIDLFPITDVAANWADAQQRFFAAGGVFDDIYASLNHRVRAD